MLPARASPMNRSTIAALWIAGSVLVATAFLAPRGEETDGDVAADPSAETDADLPRGEPTESTPLVARTVEEAPLWEPDLVKVGLAPAIESSSPITGVSLLEAPDFMLADEDVRARLGLGDAENVLLAYVATRNRVEIWWAEDPEGPWTRAGDASPVFDLSELGQAAHPLDDGQQLHIGQADGPALLRDIELEVDDEQSRVVMYFSAAGNGRRVLRDAGAGDVPVSTWAASSANGIDFGSTFGDGDDDIAAQVVGPRAIRRFDVDGQRFALSSGSVVSEADWDPLRDEPTSNRRDAAWTSAASERNTVLDDAIDEMVTGPIPRPDPERSGVLASIPSVAVLGGDERTAHVLFTVESDASPVPATLRGISGTRLDAGSTTWWNWRPVTTGADGDQSSAISTVLLPEHEWEGETLRTPDVVAHEGRAVVAYVSGDRLAVGIAIGALP